MEEKVNKNGSNALTRLQVPTGACLCSCMAFRLHLRFAFLHSKVNNSEFYCLLFVYRLPMTLQTQCSVCKLQTASFVVSPSPRGKEKKAERGETLESNYDAESRAK
jgi:hypothetical protein